MEWYDQCHTHPCPSIWFLLISVSLCFFFFYSFICVYVCFPLPMFVIPIYVSRKGMLGFNKLHLKTNILVFWFWTVGLVGPFCILFVYFLFSFFFFCLLEGLCYFWCQFPSQLVRNDKSSLSICLFVSLSLCLCVCRFDNLHRFVFFAYIASCNFLQVFSFFFSYLFFLRWGGGDKRNNNN